MTEKPFNHFLPETKEILLAAQRIAQNQEMTSGHILAAMAELENSVAFDLLMSHNLDTDKLNLSLSIKKSSRQGKTKLSPESRKIIKSAMTIAKKNDHRVVAPEHLLMAICSERGSAGYKLLKELDLNPSQIKEEINNLFLQAQQMSKKRLMPPTMDEIPIDQLDQIGTGLMLSQAKSRKDKKILPTFTSDLVKQAKKNKLDPLIGRSKELKRVIKILNRRTKNNPVLVGEAGVGKTAIVEGLAQKIAWGDVPEGLKNKRVLSLDLSLILAGTKYRGQFEERIKRIIKEIKNDPRIILLDEVHTLAGAGAAEGSIDAANIIKPALAKGELRLIGATTLDEYRKYIEKDNALERRLQIIKVDEPSKKQTVQILTGLKSNYEKHHGVEITAAAIKQAVELSDRYIGDRRLPDKAIDLIDEAASAKNLTLTETGSSRLQQIEKKIQTAIKQKEQAVVKQDYEEAANQREYELKLKEQLIKEKRKIKKSQKKSSKSVRKILPA